MTIILVYPGFFFIEGPIPNQKIQRSCIYVLWVYDFSIRFRNCSDSV